jgi:hypothetical protein
MLPSIGVRTGASGIGSGTSVSGVEVLINQIPTGIALLSHFIKGISPEKHRDTKAQRRTSLCASVSLCEPAFLGPDQLPIPDTMRDVRVGAEAALLV